MYNNIVIVLNLLMSEPYVEFVFSSDCSKIFEIYSEVKDMIIFSVNKYSSELQLHISTVNGLNLSRIL